MTSRLGLVAAIVVSLAGAAVADDAPAAATPAATAAEGAAQAPDAAVPAASDPAPARPAPAASEPAPAASAAPAPAPAAPALELEAGKPLEIVCTSKSVVVATNAANATNGSFRVTLALTGSAADKSGTWTPVSADASHKGSLAAMQAKTCAGGCPMIYETGGDVQLWAPAPKGVDKLGPDEILLLAVLKTGTWQLKASTFRGQQIEALESGSCRRAEPDVTTEPKP